METPAVTPLMTSEFSTDSARRANELIGLRRVVELESAGQLLRIRFESLQDVSVGMATIQLAIGGESCWISLGSLAEFTALSSLLGDVYWQDLTPVMQAAVLEAAFGPLLDQASSRTGVHWEIEAVGSPPPKSADTVGFTIEIGTDGNRAVGQVAANEQVFDLIVEQLQAFPPSAAWSASELRSALPVMVGSAELPAEQVADLGVGDVLLLDPLPPRSTAATELADGSAADSSAIDAPDESDARTPRVDGFGRVGWVPWSVDQQWSVQFDDEKLQIEEMTPADTTSLPPIEASRESSLKLRRA